MEFKVDIPEINILITEIRKLSALVEELKQNQKPVAPTRDKLISSKEAKSILGISTSTLFRLEAKGKIKFTQHNGNNSKKYYSLKEIEKYRDSLLK